MYASAVFHVRHRDLVIGRNLQFCACFVPLAAAYLWALNMLLLPGG
jgi:hypothetical protein